MHSFTRTLVAALAILALAAPVASARVDPPSSKAAPAPSRGAVYWSYDYQAPKPAAHSTATSAVDFPWLTFGFGVAGAFLLAGATVAAVTRRPRRAGIA